jgi:hypothetical protein
LWRPGVPEPPDEDDELELVIGGGAGLWQTLCVPTTVHE